MKVKKVKTDEPSKLNRAFGSIKRAIKKNDENVIPKNVSKTTKEGKPMKKKQVLEKNTQDKKIPKKSPAKLKQAKKTKISELLSQENNLVKKNKVLKKSKEDVQLKKNKVLKKFKEDVQLKKKKVLEKLKEDQKDVKNKILKKATEDTEVKKRKILGKSNNIKKDEENKIPEKSSEEKVKKKKKVSESSIENSLVPKQKDSKNSSVKKTVEKEVLNETHPQEKQKAEKTYSTTRGVVYIGHIPHGFYEAEMKEYFEQFGVVTRVRVARSKKTGKSRGYGYVEFEVPEVAKIAAETMNNYLMCGRLLRTTYIAPEKQHWSLFKGRPWTEKIYPKIANRMKELRKNESEISEKAHKVQVKRSLKKISLLEEKLKSVGVNIKFKPADLPEWYK